MENLKIAEFVQKSTGKTVYRLKERPLNDFFWEKVKLVKLQWLVKDKDYEEKDIEIRDLSKKPDIEIL